MTFSNFAAHALVTTTLAMTTIHGAVAQDAMTAIHGAVAQDLKAILTTAHIITPSDSPVPGSTVYYNESAIKKFTLLQRDSGNGQLAQDFVYDDPRNALFDGNPGITFAIAEENTSDDVNLENQAWWLEESLRIWESEVCSLPFLTRVYFAQSFSGIVNIFFNTGQIPLIQIADVTQVGFFSAEEFPFFAANPNVLGVAFTLSWVDPSGNLTDIDENGKADVAFREIYYNDAFEWSDNGVGGERGSGIIDFPTVAIHEAGHGLSADHFGSIGRRGDALVANPRAIMNAIYGGPLRQLTGRDEAAHCSNWSQWPLH